MSVLIWNQRYAGETNPRSIKYEPWLDRWKSLFPPAPAKALDLGCGTGFDTETLLGLGHHVTAIDFSANAVAVSRQRNPKATHFIADLREIAPLLSPPYDLVIASLSLHYFSQEDTLAIFRNIDSVLRPGGFFAFRLNAYDETGAPADASSWNLTTVEGLPKQFYTVEKIHEALAGNYRIHSIEKSTTDRYGKIKSLFEVIAERSA